MDDVTVGAPPAAGVRVEQLQGVIAGEDTGPLYWMLRIACAAEFIGHGAFGVITKADWVPYFGVVGIPPSLHGDSCQLSGQSISRSDCWWA